MAVNEENIPVLIRSLTAIYAGWSEKAATANRIAQAMQKIKKIDGQNPPDPDTGQIMTDARRDEIYDKCIGPARDLMSDEG